MPRDEGKMQTCAHPIPRAAYDGTPDTGFGMHVFRTGRLRNQLKMQTGKPEKNRLIVKVKATL